MRAAAKKAIVKLAISEYPNEMVGYLKDNKFHPLQNTSKTPEERYQLSIKDKLLVLSDGIQGLVHSHPHLNNMPSELDSQAQKSTGIPFFIIGTDGVSTTEIREVS